MEGRLTGTDFVRIWNVDDDGKAFVHLMASGRDHTICGHDAVGDDLVHGRPCEHLLGKHRVTCVQCLGIISDVRKYIRASH
jgi:hypothetical protein